MKNAQATAPRVPGRRLWRLALGELGFAARYGIIPLYGLLTVVYLLMLSVTPPQSRGTAGGVIILTDPAAMGLFFMGAMVLLEKSQQVHCALAASPVRPWEYAVGKAVPLTAVGLCVALPLAAFAQMPLWGVALATVLGSFLFSMLGILVATNSDSLNRFLIYSIPVEIVAFVPAMFYWFGSSRSPLWLLHPCAAALALMTRDTGLWLWATLSLLVWNIAVFPLCRRAVERYFIRLGGVRL
ncbi:MAG: ABC transporter permease [Clostridiales bacterium]|nr:ABC transporter permease [Clostridiales bacterium]